MNQTAAALDFKSANLYALRAVLRDADSARLAAALAAHMARAGSLFEGEPVVIDASLLPEDARVDWPALIARLRDHNLPVIGMAGDGALRDAAIAAGLTALELSAATTRTTATDTAPAEPESAPSPASTKDAKTPGDTPTAPTSVPTSIPTTGLLITRPLRSGQRVYARGTDLTVVGSVSAGSEILADGNIHVYGPLRGKAMAGARGNTAARIFTTQFDPELIAIAGVYQVVEQKLAPKLANRPVQVWLADERLRIEAL